MYLSVWVAPFGGLNCAAFLVRVEFMVWSGTCRERPGSGGKVVEEGMVEKMRVGVVVGEDFFGGGIFVGHACCSYLAEADAVSPAAAS